VIVTLDGRSSLRIGGSVTRSTLILNTMLTIIVIIAESYRMRPPLARISATLAALAVIASASACGTPADRDPQHVNVVAAFYPLQYLAERVGGDRVRVTNLTRPGIEPHEMDLKPSQVIQVSGAELVVYQRGLQPMVDQAVGDSGDRLFDAAAAVPLIPLAPEALEDGAKPGAPDPHIWLDPQRYLTVGTRLSERLTRLDPAGKDSYPARLAAFTTEMVALDNAYRTGLAQCARHEIVTSHAAFGYLARRYGLTQIPIAGLSADEETSPRRLAEIAATARSHHATTIFFEALVSPKVAQTVAREIGATTAVLDPIEGVTGADDYLVVMRRNLATLRQALGCR